MDFIKKEWKRILIILWLAGITVFLFLINNQLGDLRAKSAKLSSTVDSVESVAISTDSNIVELGKKVDQMGADISFVVQKVRRN